MNETTMREARPRIPFLPSRESAFDPKKRLIIGNYFTNRSSFSMMIPDIQTFQFTA